MAAMTTINEPLCFMCQHLVFWPYCMAFDGEIPAEIRRGEIDHREPVEGDHGLVWEPVRQIGEALSFDLREGGPGSGNWGHRGRLGNRGGSMPGGGHGAVGAGAVQTRKEELQKINRAVAAIDQAIGPSFYDTSMDDQKGVLKGFLTASGFSEEEAQKAAGFYQARAQAHASYLQRKGGIVQIADGLTMPASKNSMVSFAIPAKMALNTENMTSILNTLRSESRLLLGDYVGRLPKNMDEALHLARKSGDGQAFREQFSAATQWVDQNAQAKSGLTVPQWKAYAQQVTALPSPFDLTGTAKPLKIRQVAGEKLDPSSIVNAAVQEPLHPEKYAFLNYTALHQPGFQQPEPTLVRRLAEESELFVRIGKATNTNMADQVGKLTFSDTETLAQAFNGYLNKRYAGMRARYSKNSQHNDSTN